MREFQRELRYLVAKVRDVETALTDGEKQELAALLKKVEQYRTDSGKPPLECVVVESDWPNYEETWASVQQVWESQQTEPTNVVT